MPVIGLIIYSVLYLGLEKSSSLLDTQLRWPVHPYCYMHILCNILWQFSRSCEAETEGCKLCSLLYTSHSCFIAWHMSDGWTCCTLRKHMTASWAASFGFAIPRFLTDGTCFKTLLSANVYISEHSIIYAWFLRVVIGRYACCIIATQEFVINTWQLPDSRLIHNLCLLDT